MKNKVIWALLALNVLLAIALLTPMVQPAEAQAPRPGDYLMIPGEIVGGNNAVTRPALLGLELPLAEVAVGAGFSDQSHFTRVFSRTVGTSPGTWRRIRLSRRSHACNPSALCSNSDSFSCWDCTFSNKRLSLSSKNISRSFKASRASCSDAS